MLRFKPGDAVYILPKFAHLYPDNLAAVVSVEPDPHRPAFNTYDVEFDGGSIDTVFEFQIIENLPRYKTIIATVVFDSRRQLTAVEGRGGTSDERVILQTHQFDLDIKIQIENSHASLMGQLLERGTTNLLNRLQVRLIKGGMTLDTTTSDSVGTFKFGAVPRGSLDILILIPQYLERILGALTI
jgi:hypothetical protein